VRVIKGFPLPLAPSRQGREYWMEGLALEILEILRGVHPERCVRFFAEFILSAILRSVPSLRMAENEGARMTASEGPRMTEGEGLRMTAATN